MALHSNRNEARQVVALLGGAKNFPLKIRDLRDLQAALRQGIPYAAFEAVLSVLRINSKELAQLIGVASRTLARRKAQGLLTPIESDRLYRVARITILAAEVLGSRQKARLWLHKDNQALGGDSPVSLLDTEIGEHQVEELLNRINFGILS